METVPNNHSFLLLDVRSQMCILEKLDLPNLLRVAETNKHLSQLAVEVYNQNFIDKPLKIQAPTFPNRFKMKVGNEIIVADVEIILKFLKVFGTSIRALRVQYERIDFEDAKKITLHINQYCSESVTHIGFSGITKEIWYLLKKPFASVHDVAFRKIVEPAKGMKINQKFPQLRTLMLLDTIVKEPKIFDSKFSHLDHLFITTLRPENDFANQTKYLLKNNPQIRHLSVQHNFRSFLENMTNELQHIETLELLWPQDDYSNGNQIHLNHVKKLIVTSNSFPVPTKIVFTKLEEIECFCYPELNNEYIDYMGLNKNLIRLNITSDVNNDQFIRLQRAFTRLVEASLKCGGDVTANTVIEFIEMNTKLDKLRLLNNNQSLYHRLLDNLKQKWEVTTFFDGITYGVYLERHPNWNYTHLIYTIVFLVFIVLVVLFIKKMVTKNRELF